MPFPAQFTHNIDRAKRLFEARGRGVEGGKVGYVRLRRHCHCAQALDIIACCLKPGVSARDKPDPPALLGKQCSGGTAYAGGRAGDDHDGWRVFRQRLWTFVDRVEKELPKGGQFSSGDLGRGHNWLIVVCKVTIFLRAGPFDSEQARRLVAPS